MYIKFEMNFFAPPPFLFYICSPNEIYFIEGVRAVGKKISALFLQFLVNFKKIGGKICLLFTNWGINMRCPSLFHPLSIIFFRQHVIWPYFCHPRGRRGGGSNRKIYTPACGCTIWLCVSSSPGAKGQRGMKR